MNDRENRRREMFVDVQEFGREHAADFPAAGVAGQLFATLTAVIDQLNGHAAFQSSSDGAARQGTATRSQAREAVRDHLDAINRTARAMADQVSGLDDKFRLPRVTNDQTLMSTARAFLADAEPLSAQFIAHELPADFLQDLNANIDAFELATQAQSSGLGQRVAAGAAIDSAVDNGVAAVRKLGALVKNKYTNNPAVLAQWTSVSHTERNPRRKPSGRAAIPDMRRFPQTPGILAR
jgi:hypothetical protein